MTERLDALLEFAHTLADAGAAVHRRHFGTPHAIETKDDGSPVTPADREAERAVRALIAAAHPEDGVLGEEYGAERTDARRVWIVDPVDGTRSFACAIPTGGVLIALAEAGAFVLGVVDVPMLGQRWSARRGGPATGNGRPVATRRCARLEEAILCTVGPVRDPLPEDEAIGAVRRHCRWTRYGMDSFAYGLLASGHVDVVLDHGLGVHDFAPLVPIVEAAGGRAVDWEGRPLGPGSGARICAVGDPGLLPQVLDRLGSRP